MLLWMFVLVLGYSWWQIWALTYRRKPEEMPLGVHLAVIANMFLALVAIGGIIFWAMVL